MSIIEELTKPKTSKQDLGAFADKAEEALAGASKALSELQQKQRELKEQNLTINTVNALVSRISNLEDKFDTLVSYIKLSTDVLAKESALLDKIEASLKM